MHVHLISIRLQMVLLNALMCLSMATRLRGLARARVRARVCARVYFNVFAALSSS